MGIWPLLTFKLPQETTLGVRVAVLVGVGVAVLVAVFESVEVAVEVKVDVKVPVVVLVAVIVAVFVVVGVEVLVAVPVAVLVAVGVPDVQTKVPAWLAFMKLPPFQPPTEYRTPPTTSPPCADWLSGMEFTGLQLLADGL